MELTDEVINLVEKTLRIKLYDGQKQYLLDNGDYWFGGRASGKTVAYCIKLALSDGEPLDMHNPIELCDSDYGVESNKPNYSKWFRSEFLSIWNVLKDAGFQVRKVKS